MSNAKQVTTGTFSPQYFIINKSEPRYDLIKIRLLDSTSIPPESSHYFIQVNEGKGCICRIRAGNGTILFYEIVNHLQRGISDDDIQGTLDILSNAAPLPGYFYVTPDMREKLEIFPSAGSSP